MPAAALRKPSTAIGSMPAPTPTRCNVAPSAAHGNSKLATGAQHVYAIMRTDAAGKVELWKYGISGGGINTAGLSGRAQTQVGALNKASGGQYTYSSQIVKGSQPGQALEHRHSRAKNHMCLSIARRQELNLRVT